MLAAENCSIGVWEEANKQKKNQDNFVYTVSVTIETLQKARTGSSGEEIINRKKP